MFWRDEASLRRSGGRFTEKEESLIRSRLDRLGT